MFIDIVIDQLIHSSIEGVADPSLDQDKKISPSELYDLMVDFNAASRLVLADEVVAAASALVLPPDTPTPLPHPVTWFEWVEGGSRHGVLWFEAGSDNGMPGGLYFNRVRPPGAERYQQSTTPLVNELANADIDSSLLTPERTATRAHLNFPAAGRMLASVCHMIAAPKIITYREPNLSILNAKRERKGRAPLLTYREIALNLSDEERTAIRSGGGTGEGKALHRCRSFMRVRRGKVEMVRSHWRGSLKHGRVVSSYNVRKS